MKFIKLIFISALLCASAASHAQKLNCSDYQHKKDSLNQKVAENWEWHNASIPPLYHQVKKIQKEIDSLTAKKDSLNALRDSLMEVSKQRREFLYAEKVGIMLHDAPYSEEAIKDLFISKHSHSREILEEVYQASMSKVKRSTAYKRLEEFLYNEYPSLIGTSFKPFSCYTLNGKRYSWKSHAGKKTVIILDGFYCMNPFEPSAAGVYLKSILEKTDQEKVSIIPFVYAENVDQMKKTCYLYNIQELNPISDMEGELSELKLKYQVEGTPTVIYIDANGTIVHYEFGLDLKRFEEFVQN